MSLTVSNLINLNISELKTTLEHFIQYNESVFAFNYTDERTISELFDYLTGLLISSSATQVHNLILLSMALIIRDPMSSIPLANTAYIDTLSQFILQSNTALSALKCAYNSTIQSSAVRDYFVVENSDFTVRVADFMLGLGQDFREERHIGLKFMGYLSSLPGFPVELLGNKLTKVVALSKMLFSELRESGDCSELIDCLKLLYNATLCTNLGDGLAGVVQLVRNILLVGTSATIQQCINIITNIPPGEVISEHLVFDEPHSHNGIANGVYKNKNMGAVSALVIHMAEKLEYVYARGHHDRRVSFTDIFLPTLQCIITVCKSSRDLRHYCRLLVLPYLRDEVTRLPHTGNSIRNRMCKLMQCSDSLVSHAAAYLMFVLCNCSVDRLVKYTGYGNAAGFLSSSLLEAAETNEDSDFSGTEEYSRLSEDVNPVTGRYEPPRACELSEGEKEYQIEQLIIAMDKLDRLGVIKPMKLDADNHPRPVEHVLELFDKSDVKK